MSCLNYKTILNPGAVKIHIRYQTTLGSSKGLGKRPWCGLPNQSVRLVSKEQATEGSLEVEGKQLPVQVFRDMNSMPNWAGPVGITYVTWTLATIMRW